MRRRTAAALSRYSRRHGSVLRLPLARAAWRVLVAAGDRGEQAAIEAVWRSWLRDPDDERWQLLSRWRGSRAAADAACEAALEALPERVLADFCCSHDLKPADPVRRAVFLMLTGQ